MDESGIWLATARLEMAIRQRGAAIVEFMKVWGVVTALVVAGFVATYQFVSAPPPRVIRIATGGVDGAYYAFARQYAELLAADGIALEIFTTAGSVENLRLVTTGEVMLALVQGGTASDAARAQLRALGSLFVEPLWVFTPARGAIGRLSELKGGRVAIGQVGSGTNLLATQLLSANGITASNTTLITEDAAAMGSQLSRGALDALLLVASPSAPSVQELLRQQKIELFDFERAEAYGRIFPALTPVVLNQGILNLERNLPPRDTTVVAVGAMLVARADLNPNLVPAVLDAVTRVHRGGGVLEQPRQFPSLDLVDLPMNEDAARYIAQGPSLLYRWLPYGTAVRLDRLKLMIVPFVALLIPLLRVAPSLYTWRIRSKIYRWYAQVRDIDQSVEKAPRAAADRLARLEREVAAVTVPLAYTGELYHLRLHVRLLQQRLREVDAVRPG